MTRTGGAAGSPWVAADSAAGATSDWAADWPPEVANGLAAHRAELVAQLARLTAPAGEPEVQLGFGKRAGDFTAMATERTERVVTVERLSAQLAAVQRAEAKLAAGSYGQCDACRGPIGADRLAALPAAVLCLNCKKNQRMGGERA